jgi:hypothetical protein
VWQSLTLRVFGGIDIQVDDLYTPLSKILGHQLSYPARGACYHDNLLAIDELGILLPVVDDILRQFIVEKFGDIVGDEDLQPLKNSWRCNPWINTVRYYGLELIGIVEKGK